TLWIKSVLGVVVVSLVPAAVQAKTIILTDEDCERMAAISADAPRMSWAGYEASAGVFTSIYIDLYSQRGFLIRYPLDKIPKGQRASGQCDRGRRAVVFRRRGQQRLDPERRGR